MSSTSSVCSSDADILLDSRGYGSGAGMGRKEMQPHVRRAIERFSLYCSRLRATLDVESAAEEGDAMCVSVHAALEQLNESVRELLRIDQFKTNAVILPSIQLVAAVKNLKFDASSHVDTGDAAHVLDCLESAVLNTLIQQHMATSMHVSSSMTGRRSLQQPPLQAHTSLPPNSSTINGKRHSTSPFSTRQSRDDHTQNSSGRSSLGSSGLSIASADEILCNRPDGVDIAFERAKTSSRYCKELAIFVKGRLHLEAEHAKKVNGLVEQTRLAINESFLPLRAVFESGFECELDFASTVKETIDHLNDRFLKALEARRSEHDSIRRSLKAEWAKEMKSLADAENEERRTQQNVYLREEGIRKVRRESARTAKDADRRRKAEEEALLKLEEAQRMLANGQVDVRDKRSSLYRTKERTIERLRDLVLQCDQTTKACASHYFKALSSLWMGLPHRLSELAERVRIYEPGAEYMSYVHALPTRSTSIGGVRHIRDDSGITTTTTTSSEGGAAGSVASPGGSSSSGSTSAAAPHRRNAAIPQEAEREIEGIRKHKKSSTGRIIDRASWSDAARSHHVQRTMQPGKCAHCERVSLLTPLQCTACGAVWHKACFPMVSDMCGHAPARRTTSERRMSIFGVSLEGHLREEQRAVPFIIESTINEIQSRGMRVKGIYRTCGVKSKVEEICEQFEKCRIPGRMDVTAVHPMNLASVVKLYLRKLPVPLLTHSLYDDWKAVPAMDNEDEQVAELSRLIALLPPHNRSTLQFVLLHLNRVTWFHDSNLMCASNLSTVVAPSLIWPQRLPTSAADASSLTDANVMNITVKLLIRHAFALFDVDRDADWAQFSALYAMEMPSRDTGGEEDEEPETPGKTVDIEDDDEEDEDEIFLPQPPTPDLLKSTRTPPSSAASLQHGGEASTSKETQNHVDIRHRPAAERRRDTRRSYTTSILISPRGSSHPMNKQQSIDEQLLADVTMDIAKGQFFSEERGGGSRRGNGGIERRQSDKERIHSRTPIPPPDENVHVLNLQDVGDLFPGNDVSYV